MSQLCFICSKLLIASETVVVDRGMKTLIDTSVKRSDRFYEYLKDLKPVTIHVVCHKMYTRKSTVVAFKRQQDIDQVSTSENSPPRTRARVSESFFCLKKCCIFCGDEANKEAEKKKAKKVWHKIHKVATIEFKESIQKVAWSRSDEEAKKVTAHIEYEFDLVAAEAKYHNTCYNSFMRPTNGCKIGRPQDESTNVAMEEIFKYIENSDDCQFSLEELKNICKNSHLDNRTIKTRLKLKFCYKIIITEKPGKLTFIFFDNHSDILNQAWYEKKSQNKEEQFRILKTAAAIIREDILSLVFDNTNYPSPSQMFEDINSDIPESLSYFLEQVILKNKRSKLEHLKLVCTSISHSIMSVVRPRSFKSKLQLGLSVFFHRRFGSKLLIQIFSSFGLCASYNDALMYEAAAVLHHPPFILPPQTGTFIQYIADNADINLSKMSKSYLIFTCNY